MQTERGRRADETSQAKRGRSTMRVEDNGTGVGEIAGDEGINSVPAVPCVPGRAAGRAAP